MKYIGTRACQWRRVVRDLPRQGLVCARVLAQGRSALEMRVQSENTSQVSKYM